MGRGSVFEASTLHRFGISGSRWGSITSRCGLWIAFARTPGAARSTRRRSSTRSSLRSCVNRPTFHCRRPPTSVRWCGHDSRPCSEDARLLVCAASVLGLSCRLAIAGRLAELRETLVPLERAMTAHLLEEHGAPADRMIAFPHPLVQAAAYHSLGPAHRAELHERAATLVPDEASALRHRVAAARGVDPQLAADLIIFGIDLARRGAWDAAADALLSASRLTADGPERDQRTLMAAEYMLLGGAVDDVLALVDEIERQAATARRGFVLGSLAMTGGRYDRAQELLAAAYDACDPVRDHPLAEEIAAHLARVHMGRGHGADAALWATRSLDARRAPSPVSDSLSVLAIGLLFAGRAPGGCGCSGGATAGRRRWPRTRRSTDTSAAATCAASPTTPRPPARISRRWRSGCDVRGPAHQAIEALTMLATAEYRMGDWDDASVHGQLAASLAEDADQTWLLAAANAAACAPLAGRGDWDVAHRSCRGGATCRGGCRRRVRRSRSGCDGGSKHRSRSRRPRVRDPRARAPAAAGGSRRASGSPASSTGRSSTRVAGRPGSPPRCGDRRLPHSRALPGSAIARSRLPVRTGFERCSTQRSAGRTMPRSRLSASLAILDEVHLPFERALTELEYGRFLLREGFTRAAVWQLEAARERFADLDARPLPHGVRAPPWCAAAWRRRSRRGHARWRLTPQEVSVARLVATGRTNRQVADELVVSIKTVEYHLANVYGKLGIRSRQELVPIFGPIDSRATDQGRESRQPRVRWRQKTRVPPWGKSRYRTRRVELQPASQRCGRERGHQT